MYIHIQDFEVDAAIELKMLPSFMDFFLKQFLKLRFFIK